MPLQYPFSLANVRLQREPSAIRCKPWLGLPSVNTPENEYESNPCSHYNTQCYKSLVIAPAKGVECRLNAPNKTINEAQQQDRNSSCEKIQTVSNLDIISLLRLHCFTYTEIKQTEKQQSGKIQDQKNKSRFFHVAFLPNDQAKGRGGFMPRPS